MFDTENLSSAEIKRLQEASEVYRSLDSREREILDAIDNSVTQREELAVNLKDRLNGEYHDELIDHLAMIHEQKEAKKEYTSWGYVKEKAGQAAKWAWKHKWWIAGLTTAAIFGYGYYRYGDLMGGIQVMKNIGGGIANMYGAATEKIGGFLGGLKERLGGLWGGAEEIAQKLPGVPEIPGGVLPPDGVIPEIPSIPEVPVPTDGLPSLGDFDAT